MDYEYHGTDPETVRRILLERRAGDYVAGSLSDGNKLALVFEGGAMRGVISCAAGAQLEKLGFGRCFDTVYGTSAGALNAAYFVAQQAQTILDVYRTDVIGGEFMKLWRWPDQVAVKWLADNVVSSGARKLDLETLCNAGTELQIATTNAKTGRCRLFSSHRDRAETIIPALTASGCTPLFATHKEEIDGELYNDGMVRAPVASEKAIADGCSHMLALLCNPVGRRKTPSLLRAQLEYAIRIRRYPVDYQCAYFGRAVFYNDAMDALHLAERGGNTMVVCPHRNDIPPRRLEKSLPRLDAIIANQSERIEAIFGEHRSGARYVPLPASDTHQT